MTARRRRMALILAAVLSSSCASRCQAEWRTFRHDAMRSGSQPLSNVLSDHLYVRRLQTAPLVTDNLGLPSTAIFRASPVVQGGKLFIGNSNGRFYALDAATLKKLWQFPESGPALRSKFEGRCGGSFHTVASTYGIASSGLVTRVRNSNNVLRDAVVFAAPDPSIGHDALGGGRLFALAVNPSNPNKPELLRTSPPLARLTGLSGGAVNEFHEQLGYSAPLLLGDRIYIGVADHCDNPIQQGRVIALFADTLQIDTAFRFCSTGSCDDGSRGGGVWSSVAGYSDSVFVTTGNVNTPQQPFEPCPNHGLSMLRLDARTGQIVWRHRPVPFALDLDPDWAAGATIMNASCGTIAVSTQKDGWTHAVPFGESIRRGTTVPANTCPPPASVAADWAWAFPPPPKLLGIEWLPFRTTDGTTHPDTQYKRPGASFRDVYVSMAAGWSALIGNLRSGYKRLHAFNVCADSTSNRLRWILDVPGVVDFPNEHCSDLPPWNRDADHFEGAVRNCLGPPTTAGGIVFVTTNGGYLVAAADPSTGVPYTKRCAIIDLPYPICTIFSNFVAEPGVILARPLGFGPIFTEPVLVGRRVYVATDQGRVVMLEAGR